MPMHITSLPAKFFEQFTVKDIFVSDVGRIDLIGDNVRFVFVVAEAGQEGAPLVYHPVAKLVMPRTAIHGAMQRTAFALGQPLAACVPSPSMRVS